MARGPKCEDFVLQNIHLFNVIYKIYIISIKILMNFLKIENNRLD